MIGGLLRALGAIAELMALLIRRQERAEAAADTPQADVERVADAATRGDEQKVQDAFADWRRTGRTAGEPRRRV